MNVDYTIRDISGKIIAGAQCMELDNAMERVRSWLGSSSNVLSVYIRVTAEPHKPLPRRD